MADPTQIERRAQQRARAHKLPVIGCRPPADPINQARLQLWRERLREVGVQRHRMQA